MGNTYIKFKVTDSITKKVPGKIGKKLPVTELTDDPPVSNPDYIDQIDKVASWLIEFENDSYFANREVGLDISGCPIMKMPQGKNYGYWTDNDLVIENFRKNFVTKEISKEEFEKGWKGIKD